MNTNYRLHSIASVDGHVVARLVVGKHDRLQDIPLSRPEAWRLFRELAKALEVTE